MVRAERAARQTFKAGDRVFVKGLQGLRYVLDENAPSYEGPKFGAHVRGKTARDIRDSGASRRRSTQRDGYILVGPRSDGSGLDMYVPPSDVEPAVGYKVCWLESSYREVQCQSGFKTRREAEIFASKRSQFRNDTRLQVSEAASESWISIYHKGWLVDANKRGSYESPDQLATRELGRQEFEKGKRLRRAERSLKNVKDPAYRYQEHAARHANDSFARGRAAGFQLPPREARALTEKFAPAVERAKRVTALKKVRDFLMTNDPSTARFVQGMIEAERAHVDTRTWAIPHRVLKAMLAVDEGRHRVPRERVSLMTPVPVAMRGHARGRAESGPAKAKVKINLAEIAANVDASARQNAIDTCGPDREPSEDGYTWDEIFIETLVGLVDGLTGREWDYYAPRQLTSKEAAKVLKIVHASYDNVYT